MPKIGSGVGRRREAIFPGEDERVADGLARHTVDHPSAQDIAGRGLTRLRRRSYREQEQAGER